MKESLYLFLLASTLLFSSCATLLNPKLQPVEVKTKSKDSKVYIDGEYVGKGKTVSTKIERDAEGKKVVIKREGYKNQYKTLTPEKKSAWYIMSWIPGVILLAPPFMDIGAKAYNYNQVVPSSKPVELVIRQDNERYLLLEAAAMKLEKNSFRVKSGLNISSARSIETNSDRLKIDNSIFSVFVDSILEKNNFSEPEDKMLVNPSSYLILNMEVNELTIYRLYRKYITNRAHYTPYYYVIKPSITWELSNIYGDELHSETIKVRSDEFLEGIYSDEDLPGNEDPTMNAFNDAIEVSLYEFLESPKVKEHLPVVLPKNVAFQEFGLKDDPFEASEIEDAMQAGVTILTDNGHGSGFFIAENGLILTNYHVVSSENRIDVRTQSGKEFKAKVIRSNQEADLALLKIEGTGFRALSIPNQKNFELGKEIIAMGTPSGVDLGQTISSGIVSAERTLENSDFKWIQMDVSVSPGSSGGPIISPEGELIGVVNGKIYGLGIEGISFAIPAYEIWDILDLKSE